jgi:hypothetical protein
MACFGNFFGKSQHSRFFLNVLKLWPRGVLSWRARTAGMQEGGLE